MSYRGSLRAVVLSLLAAVFAGGPVDAAQAPKLPADAQVIVHFDWSTLVRSEVFKKVGPMIVGLSPARDPEFRAFCQATGLDPWKDIERGTVVLGGDLTTEGSTLQAAFIARARPEDVRQALVEDGRWTITQQDGEDTFTLTIAGDDEPAAIVPLQDGPTFCVPGPQSFMSRDDFDGPEIAVDPDEEGPAKPDRALILAWRDAEPLTISPLDRGREDPLWLSGPGDDVVLAIAARVPEKTKQTLQEREATAHLECVESVGFSVEFTDDLALTLSVKADTAANADKVRESMEPLAARGEDKTVETKRLLNALRRVNMRDPAIPMYVTLSRLLRMAKHAFLELPARDDLFRDGGADALSIDVLASDAPEVATVGLTISLDDVVDPSDFLVQLTGVSAGVKE